MEAAEKTPAQELGSQLRGEVIGPNDDGYDDARKIWNGMIDKRPAMIVRCTGVVAAARRAAELADEAARTTQTDR